MIEVEQLCVGYTASRLALDHVSFRAERGEVVGLLGENGAGKTTLLRVLAGLLHPQAGRVRIAGCDVVQQGSAARRALGYLPEELPLDGEFRIEEFLGLRAALKGLDARQQRQRVDEVCTLLDLQGQRRQLIVQLSKGYRQRVGLADALLASPPVLLLDEPTDGLDPPQRAQTLRLIADLAQRHTVLLSTHVLPEAESICQRLLILDRGRLLADGSPSSLLADQPASHILLLQCAGPADALCTAVRQVAGVAAVTPRPGTGPAVGDDDPSALAQTVTLLVELAPDAEPATADRIARAVLPLGRLLALAPQPRSLVSLFQQLTRKSAG